MWTARQGFLSKAREEGVGGQEGLYESLELFGHGPSWASELGLRISGLWSAIVLLPKCGDFSV